MQVMTVRWTSVLFLSSNADASASNAGDGSADMLSTRDNVDLRFPSIAVGGLELTMLGDRERGRVCTGTGTWPPLIERR